jgi:tetratricopeptide (TPR) repeat protein
MKSGVLVLSVLLGFSCASAAAQEAATPQPAASQVAASPADALAQAQALLDSGDTQKALATLKTIQAASPDLPHLNRALGVAYYRTGDYLRSSVYLEKATAGDPKDPEAVQLLGLAYFFTGKPKQAIPLLERVQQWYPAAHVDASYVLGISYIQTMDYDKARKAFATMYGVPADSAASHLFLARMLLRQGYDPIAEEEAKKAIALDAHLPMVHSMLGDLYIFKSRIPEAVQEFQAELAINPGDANAYYRLADAETRIMRWDDAEKLLQRSLWLDATSSGPYVLMGKVLLKKNDPVLAVRSLDRALKMDPNNYIAHHLLGEAYRALGRESDADNELKTSERLQAEQTHTGAEMPRPQAQ